LYHTGHFHSHQGSQTSNILPFLPSSLEPSVHRNTVGELSLEQEHGIQSDNQRCYQDIEQKRTREPEIGRQVSISIQTGSMGQLEMFCGC
jgi:hypothetical protein